jgi:type II secretory pathway pseudopilin PulG
MRHHQRPERPRDEGMTLVEMMVAIGLAMMLMLVVLTFTIAAIRASDATEARNDNLTAAQVGMAGATKVIRTAVLPNQLSDHACSDCESTAIVIANGSQMSFYANLDNDGNGPSLVTLQAVPDPETPGTTMLRQRLIPPTPLSDGAYTFCDISSPTCTFRTWVLVRGLPADPTIFSYYDFDGAALDGGALSDTELKQVASIDVSLQVQLRAGQTRTPPENIVQRVSLPNADVNVGDDE